MCGLAAIFAYHDAAPAVRDDEVVAIRDHMASRGPDGTGAWRSPDGRAGLGHRRLAIIDLDERAAQPMVSRCGRFVISYNGEIYNYPELRAELLEDGVQLRTESDTEVLLELFARDGTAAFGRMIGMFAAAIWDGREHALWLARDSYGIKPLYFADDGWTLRAASQVKALLAGGGVSRDPEPAGVVGFFLWGAVPEPFTLYQEIRAVPPGHFVRVDRFGPATAVPFLSLESLYRVASEQPVSDEAVREAVLASVGRHLIADVPVGIFLSAGIDSAAILAAIHALDPQRAAATLSVTLGFRQFAGRDSDEVPLAAEVARRYGARHLVRTVDEREFQEDLPRLIEAMDQPSIDGVNSWFVSKAAVEAGLKVALSGVGGDELFGGYPSFREIPHWRRVLAVPSRVPGLDHVWRAALSTLPYGRTRPKLSGLLRHGRDWEGAYLLKRGLFLPHELQSELDADLVRSGLERLTCVDRIGALLSGAPKGDMPRVSLMESSLYMRNQLLRDADWASMAHSLELRTPLVDVALLRAIAPMQSGLRGKDVLARALGLPDAVRHRPKTGFVTPVDRWMCEAFAIPRTDEPWGRGWARIVAGRFRGEASARAPARERSLREIA